MAITDNSSGAKSDLEYAIELSMAGKKDPDFAARVQAETEASAKKSGENTAS